jgi:hypothetical protein
MALGRGTRGLGAIGLCSDLTVFLASWLRDMKHGAKILKEKNSIYLKTKANTEGVVDLLKSTIKGLEGVSANWTLELKIKEV